jgi:AmmeMemoRadiSam system protein A
VGTCLPARTTQVGFTVSATTDEVAGVLTRYARACIREALGGPPAPAPRGGVYDEPGAAFVSLHAPGDRLQGCIGTLKPHRSLAEDVAANARAAAFDDPRARRLHLEEVDALEVEVAVLGPLEPVPAADEAEACAALRPGVDGVLLAWEGKRATFIPQMWRYFTDARALLAELKQKAGLPSDFWAPDMEVWRYQATVAVDPPRAG